LGGYGGQGNVSRIAVKNPPKCAVQNLGNRGSLEIREVYFLFGKKHFNFLSIKKKGFGSIKKKTMIREAKITADPDMGRE
jgi:hypothetical protein